MAGKPAGGALKREIRMTGSGEEGRVDVEDGNRRGGR